MKLTILFLFLAMLMFVSPFAKVEATSFDANSLITEPRALEARSELKPHVGLLLGLSNAEGSYSSGAEIGVVAGYQFYVPFSLAVELSTNGNESSFDSAELRRTKLLAQFSYNFAGDVPVLSKSYLGFAMGPMVESYRGNDEIELGVMPVIGFDIPFSIGPSNKDFSLGANARYLVSSSGLPNVFSTNIAAKYWF